MKPISFSPITGSIKEAAENVSNSMGIVQLPQSKQPQSAIVKTFEGAGVQPFADVEEAIKAAYAAAEAANNAVENMAAEFAKKQDVLISGETIKKVNGIDVLGNGNIVINPTIMDLKWTTNVATTRKLVPAELRKKGVKIAYRDNNSAYHVEQYQAEVIDDASWENDVNWKGCRTPMTPYFESVGYSYNLDGVTYGKPVFNDETGFYELNGLTDITEEEMTFIYKYANESQEEYCVGIGNKKARTNIPSQVNFGSPHSTSAYIRSYVNNPYLEVLHIPRGAGKTENSFRDNPNLKIIASNSYFRLAADTSNNILQNRPKLEQVLIEISKTTSVFSDKPLINYKSIRFAIDKSLNTSAITITVHPTTYGYLTGTIEPTPEVGGTKEEWQQIVTDATEKQITFATAE